MKDNISLAAKLAQIAEEIGTTAKAGTNKEQGYKYIEYAAVSGKMRSLLAKYHIIIVPTVEDYEKDEISSKSGSAGFHYVVRMRFVAINGDKPDDRIEATWLGESTDYGDKGVNKAETSGTKYFYMRLLNISEKSDEDADSVTPEPMGSVSKGGYRSNASRIDFDNLRETVSAIDDMKSLVSYYNSLALDGMSEKQMSIVERIFGDRKKELAK